MRQCSKASIQELKNELSLETRLILNSLDIPRDRDILSMRLCGFTIREIAEHYQRSPERMRQVENRAVRILKTMRRKEEV